MNSFLDGFLDGFTGAGMFLGPKPMEAVSMLEDDSCKGDELWMDSLQELLQVIASRSNDQERSEVMEQIRKIARRAPLTSQTVVESGTHR